MSFNPNLRVSTMTLISDLNTLIDLNGLYENIKPDNKIKYIEHGVNNKGVNQKQNKSRKTEKKKFFYNQITVHIFEDKIINVKIFNNGKIQMTGVKNINQGEKVLITLINIIQNIPSDILEIILTNKLLQSNPIEIALINSDFDCGFKIKREILHRKIIEKGYYSSFEPTIYPGVNIKYYFNKEKQDDGICNCKTQCNGKGKNGFCKKITVAVFNSGKIIITGGQSYEQLNKAYEFINDILKNSKEELILRENKDVVAFNPLNVEQEKI